MTSGPRALDLETTFRKALERIDRLERKLDPRFDPFQPEMVYTYSGALTVSTSPVWVRRTSGRLTKVLALLRVAGSTETVIDVFRNGEVILTITVPADALIVPRAVSLRFAPDADTLYAAITSAGTGAIDLTLIFRFNR